MAARLSRVVEGVTATAVVVSLIYVGQEIQQNTAAVQAASGQAAYEMHQARLSLYMENPALAELQVRALANSAELTAADSVQWHYDLNLRLNVYEMVDANLAAGTMAEDMGEGWLAGLPEWTCLPLARSYWERRRHTYTASFAQRVENALVAQGDCDG